MLEEYTIDLADAPEDLAEKIAQAEAAEETLLEQVAEEYPETEDSPGGFVAAPDRFEEKFHELREQQGELHARRERVRAFLEDPDQAGDWEHHEFTFKEPSTEDGLYVQGRSAALAEEAQARGEQIDERMFGVTQLLARVCIDTPPEAPEPAELANKLPQRVGEWLLNALDEETMRGAPTDLGNSSPQEALRNFKQSRPSSSDEDTTSEPSPSDTPSSGETSTRR